MSAPLKSLLCAPWCSPGRHLDAGNVDQHCRSAVWTYETLQSTPIDRDAISISIERYAYCDSDQWSEQTATVLIEVERGGGVDLLPHEVVLVAQRMLAAHAIADGTAVNW